MSNNETTIMFVIIAFALALILIMKKDTIPPQIKRPLAILALVMVSFAFFLIVYSFYTL